MQSKMTEPYVRPLNEWWYQSIVHVTIIPCIYSVWSIWKPDVSYLKQLYNHVCRWMHAHTATLTPFLSPVYEYVICRAVVLDLVHADSWYMVLWGPPDGCRTGCEIRHTDPLLVWTGLASTDVGLDGCGNVRGPWVGVQLRVKVRWRVDNQLNGSCGLSSCVGCYACELSRILDITKSFHISHSL